MNYCFSYILAYRHSSCRVWLPQSHFQVTVAKMSGGQCFDCRCTQMETLCPELETDKKITKLIIE
jgi:hypothetical protein